VVKTILLVRDHSEGDAYAQNAGLLGSPDCVVITPSNSAALRGVRLSNADLIAEFPGFRDHPESHKVIQVLTASMRVSDTKPAWRAIGT
jgi:hypothetical protein